MKTPNESGEMARFPRHSVAKSVDGNGVILRNPLQDAKRHPQLIKRCSIRNG